jgi:phage tail-like protein
MYPLTALHFEVDWLDGTTNFSEVSGLTMEREVIEYRGGGDAASYVSKVPGLNKFTNVTLKRGIVSAQAGAGLYAWFASTPVERRTVTVTLLNEERDPVMSWKLHQAFPAKLEGPGLKGVGNEVAIESLEVCCESIVVEAS